MRLTLDTNTTTFFTSSKPEVTPVHGYVEGKRSEEQSREKVTNLPLWQVIVELVQGDDAEQGKKIKVASETAPELMPRSEYKAEGILFATPYVPNGGRNAEVSYLLVGSFKPANGRPSLPNIKE